MTNKNEQLKFSRRGVATLGLIPLAAGASAASAAIPAEGDDMRVTVQKLLIIDTIRQMRARYGWHASRGDFEKIAELFAPQGLFELNMRGEQQRFEGREAILAFLSKTMIANMVFPFIHNDTVEVADNCLEAVGTCAMESNPHGRAGAFSGYYHDRAALIDGRWQFTERRFFFYTPGFERSGLDLIGQPETGLAAKRPAPIKP